MRKKTSTITSRARKLRKNSTEEEKILWTVLRNMEMFPIRFRRQQPLGQYYADFCCKRLKLIIELDGSQHADEEVLQYDAKRTNYLKSKGYTVLRFWNDEIKKKLKDVVEAILLEYERLRLISQSRQSRD